MDNAIPLCLVIVLAIFFSGCAVSEGNSVTYSIISNATKMGLNGGETHFLKFSVNDGVADNSSCVVSHLRWIYYLHPIKETKIRVNLTNNCYDPIDRTDPKSRPLFATGMLAEFFPEIFLKTFLYFHGMGNSTKQGPPAYYPYELGTQGAERIVNVSRVWSEEVGGLDCTHIYANTTKDHITYNTTSYYNMTFCVSKRDNLLALLTQKRVKEFPATPDFQAYTDNYTYYWMRSGFEGDASLVLDELFGRVASP